MNGDTRREIYIYLYRWREREIKKKGEKKNSSCSLRLIRLANTSFTTAGSNRKLAPRLCRRDGEPCSDQSGLKGAPEDCVTLLGQVKKHQNGGRTVIVTRKKKKE